MRRGAILLLLTLMITASYLTLASPAWATTLTVNSFNDRGDQSPGDRSCFTGNLVPGGGIALVRECTLRAAIEEANFNEQPDIITFASWLPGGTITLKEGRLTIANDNTFGSDLTIEGLTGGRLSVSGIRTDRVFEIASGSEVTINRLTITGGAGDSSFGGGIQNSGTLALTNSTVSNNTSNSAGGGIANLGGGLTLTNSTVSNNTAQTGGGGIHNTGTLALTNSTVSNNTSQIAGGGIYNNFGTATLANTIVASNAAPTNPDARGIFTSQANNLIGNTGNSSGWTSSDLLNLDPLLGPLQNNGGPTNTRALLPSSPAIDHAANLLCPSTDQRGVQRKDGDGNGSIVCDIGSYERSDFSSPKVSSTTPTGTTVNRGANISATFTEQMTRSTLNTSTFKLFKVNSGGSTTQITNVTVSSTTDGLKATLNPFGSSSTLLAANSTYKAVVSTGARDLAGNQLDQSPTLAGNQQKAWTFTTGST